MFRGAIAAALACLLAVLPAFAADADQAQQEAKLHALLDSLQFRSGTIEIPGADATLNVAQGFSYLDAKDAQRVLTDLWGNPPQPDVLGMLLPGTDKMAVLDEDNYAVVITHSDDGYVSDEDAAKIDYDQMLKDMQEGTRDDNKDRAKQGYPTVDLVGWAERPHYDAASHKLYWAKELAFQDTDVHTLNYDIRVLGRGGYLSLNAVATMPQLAKVEAGMQQVLPMIDFDEGHRYADFDAKTDKVAAYGIAALIAGGLAAKAGLFAKLLVVLVAAKKLIIAGVIALGGFLARMFGRKKQA